MNPRECVRAYKYGLVLVGAALALACTAVIGGEDGVEAGGSSGPSIKPQNQEEGCVGWEIAMPKRLIRLSFNQLAASLRTIFDDSFADGIIDTFDIAGPTERTFPPLGDTREGSSYIDAKWQTADGIAQAAGQHVLDNFAALTSCGDAPSDDCARTFVGTMAERAFRRPLAQQESTSLLQVYDEVKAAGGSVQEATQYSVYAIFDSPHFLYRTEFGADVTEEGPLTPYELASQLSYFLTDGPPDTDLLAAAKAGTLASPEQIAPHVDRLLADPDARVNLQSAVFASLGISRVLSVIIDPSKVPATDFNAGVAASMYHETELFIGRILWSGKVPELVTSRTSFIDANLAKLYGVPAPTTGLDADGFGQVELPTDRAGILTMPAFLTSRSRPDAQSVVGRGLAVNDALLCQQNPPFPENLATQIEAINAGQTNLSERERAQFRRENSPCNGCHPSFDPYGVALENFDLIGKFRTTDSEGRAIDPAVDLPPAVGGGTAQNAVQVGAAMASSGAISACVATKLMTYALAETGVTGDSCATKFVADRFKQGDLSFSALVREVAVSKTLTHRSGGI